MRARIVAVGLLLTIVVVMIWNVLIFAPKGRDLSKAKKEVQAAEQSELQLRATLTRLTEISRNGPEIAAQLDRLSAAVPTDPDLDGFILSANQIAVQSGIDWLSVAPAVAQAGTTGPSVIPLTISIRGGFFQVLDYLNRFEDVGRLVIVDAINVAAGGGPAGSGGGSTATTVPSSRAPTLSVTLTGRMFTLAAPAPPPGSSPASGPATTGPTPPASGNAGRATSTTAQVN